MIVVTPNLCFDRTLWVEEFAAGTVSRPSRVEVTAGGKGVNVSRTLRDLGHRPLLVGLVAERQGAALTDLLAEEGAEVLPVAVPGEVRSATIVLEASTRATVLNEPGPQVGEAELADLLTAVDGALATGGHRVLVCSGSLPPGLPLDAYGRLCDLARRHGVVSVVDAAREVLAATLAHGPDVVTPNLEEAEGLLTGVVTESSDQAGDREEYRGRALAAAVDLVARGARRAVVTAGSQGAAYADAHGTTWTDAPAVDVANPIGAGDSFVGGLTASLTDDGDWPTAVAHAVAVAGAAVEQVRAGRVDAARVAELDVRTQAVSA
ncbi:1-phosphofructokinase family hexose kinase [Solicola sp. PLA-1-18]|uniref:1-phosphofructokinase family hexose kinase n=1 Tax=Solicola sp. PLA-1-18 TaxID=3380532 RepID=UPI003B794A21